LLNRTWRTARPSSANALVNGIRHTLSGGGATAGSAARTPESGPRTSISIDESVGPPISIAKSVGPPTFIAESVGLPSAPVAAPAAAPAAKAELLDRAGATFVPLSF